jgi:SWI/SNF-related matrix-associated actin-dependent regulator 1 of chromatin subfamily A
LASSKIERWTEFWADPDHLAVRASIRPSLLAVRAKGAWGAILDDLGIPLRVEGVFRQGTHLVTLPLLARVLDVLPDDARKWLIAERPDWGTWMAREQVLHAERSQAKLAIATRSGLELSPAQSDLFSAPSPDLLAEAPPDHPGHNLYPYQKAGVQWVALTRGRCILGDEMGLGKTAQLLVYCDLEPKVRRLLVICPSVVTINWAREAARWAPSIPFVVAKNTRAVRRFASHGQASNQDQPVHPHTTERYALVVSWGLLARVLPELIVLGFDTVIADEIHNGKTERAQRTRALHEIGWLAERRLGASGTEIQNRPRELYALFAFVDPLAFPTFRPYGERFCGPKTQTFRGREVRTYQGATRLAELNALTRLYVQRREKRTVLPQLPAKRRCLLPIEAPSALVREYQSVVRGLRSGVDDGALGAVAKLRKTVGMAKVPAATEWILAAHANGEPVIVFLHHADVHAALRDALEDAGLKVGSIIGATTQAQRQAHVDAFQTGKLDVMLGSMAMKEGVTLTRASHTLHVERFWVPGDEEQSEDRAHRIGQTRGVLNTYLHLIDSLDEHVHRLIEAKREGVIKPLHDRTPINRQILATLLESGA